jgi:hypothetical protein
MKIGLVLFGHLRSYRKALQSFNHLKETLQQVGSVDVFCHTWNIEESITASWWKENHDDGPPPATVTASQIEQAYRPVKYFIEPSRQFDESGYSITSSIPVAGILSMLHSQQQVFELLKNYETEKKIRYDLVVKARYDLLYEIAPEFEKLVKECVGSNTIYLPSSNPYELIGSTSDIFSVGSREQTEKYFSFCTQFKEAAAHYASLGYRQLLPELCMTVWLDHLKVNRKELCGLRLHILRMNGEVFQINSDKNFSANMPNCFYRGTITGIEKFIPSASPLIAENTNRLVKKYWQWLAASSDEATLNSYADFYLGKWIGAAAIGKMAIIAKKSDLFTTGVIKNFFEEALRNAAYGTAKKLQLAALLFRHGYGTFFFRVWKNITFPKSQ